MRSSAVWQMSFKVVVALGLGLGAWTSGEAQRLTWLGTLGGGWSEAYGVSADGSVVVGVSSSGSFSDAFRWTPQRGMKKLSDYLNLREARAVSANGKVIVGKGYSFDGDQYAARWTETGGIEYLKFSRYGIEARGVSANGSVVVGWEAGSEGYYAFRWTADKGIIQYIYGFTRKYNYSKAYAVSADGLVVVGVARNAEGQPRAFRWIATNGEMQDLGTLGGNESTAYGISANGAVVVGVAQNAEKHLRAFRWTTNGGMQDLGTLGGNESRAYGVSADGAVVVGTAQSTSGEWHAFRWTNNGKMENLNDTYASLLTQGSVLYEAHAISPDGRYIVGKGYNADTGRTEAFLLDTGIASVRQ